jgi:hypothetical protein
VSRFLGLILDLFDMPVIAKHSRGIQRKGNKQGFNRAVSAYGWQPASFMARSWTLAAECLLMVFAAKRHAAGCYAAWHREGSRVSSLAQIEKARASFRKAAPKVD